MNLYSHVQFHILMKPVKALCDATFIQYVMSFSTVLHSVLSKSFACIKPPNMEQKSVSIVCTKF